MYNNVRNDTNPQQPPPAIAMRMSPEEMMIFRQCAREGFVKKVIPYGALGAAGAYAMIKYGYIKSHPKFGYIPSMMVIGGCGALWGMISHRYSCVQKILNLPDGHFRRQFEIAQKQIKQQQSKLQMAKEQGALPFEASEDTSSMTPELSYEDYQSPHDFDTFTGSDVDSDQQHDYYTMEPLNKFAGTTTTYEELRRKNREDYKKSNFGSESPQAEKAQTGSEDHFSRESIYRGSDNFPFDRN